MLISSTELLLAATKSLFHDKATDGKMIYVSGLDIEGAFDNANLTSLMGSLQEHRAEPLIARFVGNRLTARSFRVHLLARTRQHYSKPYIQNKGIPQGGVLSPLMWLLLISQIPNNVGGWQREKDPGIDLEGDYLMQVLRMIRPHQ